MAVPGGIPLDVTSYASLKSLVVQQPQSWWVVPQASAAPHAFWNKYAGGDLFASIDFESAGETQDGDSFMAVGIVVYSLRERTILAAACFSLAEMPTFGADEWNYCWSRATDVLQELVMRGKCPQRVCDSYESFMRESGLARAQLRWVVDCHFDWAMFKQFTTRGPNGVRTKSSAAWSSSWSSPPVCPVLPRGLNAYGSENFDATNLDMHMEAVFAYAAKTASENERARMAAVRASIGALPNPQKHHPLADALHLACSHVLFAQAT